MYTFIDVSD